MSTPSLEAGDVEKELSSQGRTDGGHHGLSDGPDDRGTHSTAALAADGLAGRLRSFERQLIKYHVEARGIQRVEPDERQALTWKGYVSIFCLWFTINLAPVNITLGMLASQVFALSFTDAALCAVFGALTGSLAVGYIATFGPVSGIRSMVRSTPPIQRLIVPTFLTKVLGLCKIHYGMVAKQTRCFTQSHCATGILHDWMCGRRPDIVSSIQ